MTSTEDAPALVTAEFDPAVVRYTVVSTLILCSIVVVLIPLLPILLPLAYYMSKLSLSRRRCVLTRRTLEVSHGVLNRVEMTIPLEKITDLQLYQGPVMRAFNIHGLKIETAGQTTSGSSGALASLLGVRDTRDFRRAVLQQRDRISEREPAAPTGENGAPGSETTLLADIRDTLLRIEAEIKQHARTKQTDVSTREPF